MSVASWLIKDEIRISKENLDLALLELKSLPQYCDSSTFDDAYASIDWFGSVCPLKYDADGNVVGFAGHMEHMDQLPENAIYSFFSLISGFIEEGSSFLLGIEDDECPFLEFRFNKGKLYILREGIDHKEDMGEQDVPEDFIQIQLISLDFSVLKFEVTTLNGCGNDSIMLDSDTELWFESLFLKEPFKEKSADTYTWVVADTAKYHGTNKKWRLTVEIRRGSSSVKKYVYVPEAVYIIFQNYFFVQKLPSELTEREVDLYRCVDMREEAFVEGL